MKESELGQALQGAVAAGSPPLAVDQHQMLALAQRARTRRRASLAAGAAALAVCAVAGTTALTGNLAFGGGGQRTQAGSGGGTGCPTGTPNPTGTWTATGNPTATPTGNPTATPTGGATGSASNGTSRWTGPSMTVSVSPLPTDTSSPVPCETGTETPWPSGQSDRTATVGPHHERAVALESVLQASLPAGAHLVNPFVQGQFDSYVGTVEVWQYSVYGDVALPNHNGTASVILDVYSPKPGDNTNLCVLARRFQEQSHPDCTVRTVNGQHVAVARPRGTGPSYAPPPTAWVVYRAPDGTVVFLAQGRHPDNGKPAKADIFTVDKMVELALSGRFTQ